MQLAELERLTLLAVGLVNMTMKLSGELTSIIQQAKEIAPEDKNALIAKIKQAQSDVPEWK